ncbi:MAG TPA: hypothetical protein VN761_02235 [Candidatus Polarisedimenticolia bacterium]|nr:hypothetical protein [Candidatus Polarisedimenticolia bacterium]
MPIRINLLAEMQAIEDLRRRDPVKRAVLIGAALVAVVFVWITSLMVERIGIKSEISGLEQKIQNGSKDYKQVLDNQQSLVDGRQRLVALRQLSTNRFLIGNVLDSLQKSTVENVQLTRLKIDQSYALTEATKPTTNAETGAVSPGKPAQALERTSLTLNAKDSSSVPGDSIGRFQAALSRNPFLHSLITNRTNDFRLTTSLTPQVDADGRTFVAFTLESHLPDKLR